MRIALPLDTSFNRTSISAALTYLGLKHIVNTVFGVSRGYDGKVKGKAGQTVPRMKKAG